MGKYNAEKAETTGNLTYASLTTAARDVIDSLNCGYERRLLGRTTSGKSGILDPVVAQELGIESEAYKKTNSGAVIVGIGAVYAAVTTYTETMGDPKTALESLRAATLGQQAVAASGMITEVI